MTGPAALPVEPRTCSNGSVHARAAWIGPYPRGYLGWGTGTTVISLGHGHNIRAGECVLIQRPDALAPWESKRFVVDLGSPGRLHRPAIDASPDVVVLTHDDDDHVGGAAEGLERLSRFGPHPHREVWLPADWLIALVALGSLTGSIPRDGRDGPTATPEDLLGWDEDSTLDDLVELDESEDREEPGGNLGAVLVRPSPADQHEQHLGPWLAELPGFDDEDLVDQIAKDIDRLRDRAGTRGPGGRKEIARRGVRRIRTIAAIVGEAARCGRVRWFSPDIPPYSNLGNPHRREAWILNAGEVSAARLPKVDDPALFLLLMVFRVTAQNRRALVTVIQPTQDNANGVIVWSDSTGEGYADPCTAPWTSAGLMTAPHHGSNAARHRPIWRQRRLQSAGTAVLLSNNPKPTTDAYTKLCGLHACTHCTCATGSTRPGRDAVAHWCRSCARWSLAEL